VDRGVKEANLGDPPEVVEPHRKLSPLRPHDLRHTFAFQLATVTGADAYELERRLGHRSQRYIQRYTNPPEAVAARYVEEFLSTERCSDSGSSSRTGRRATRRLSPPVPAVIDLVRLRSWHTHLLARILLLVGVRGWSDRVRGRSAAPVR
jgi:integrase-like protein